VLLGKRSNGTSFIFLTSSVLLYASFFVCQIKNCPQSIEVCLIDLIQQVIPALLQQDYIIFCDNATSERGEPTF
jgi:hypothetical protein